MKMETWEKAGEIIGDIDSVNTAIENSSKIFITPYGVANIPKIKELSDDFRKQLIECLIERKQELEKELEAF